MSIIVLGNNIFGLFYKISERDMKIWQVKYKSGGGDSKYLYYKAEKEEDVNDKTQFYISYTDCRDEVNVTVVYDTIKVRELLLKKYKQ